MAADLSLKTRSISGSISNTTGWDPFMGIPGFAVKQFAVSISYAAGSPEPGFGIAGTVSFPDWLSTGLNLTSGTDVSLAMKLDPAQPCLAMGVSRKDKGVAIDLLHQGVVTAKNAGFVIAPKGCDIGAISYPSGASFNLDARIFGVDTKFNANVALEGNFAMTANAEIGAWDIKGIVGMEKTHLDLDIDTGFRKKFVVEFSGGISVPGATAHVDGKVNSHDGIASLELHGDAKGAKLGDIQIPGTANFDLSATADLGTLGALKTLKTTMDADMKVLGSGIHMHFDLDYANLSVKKMSASQEATLNLYVAKLAGKVQIGYESGKGSAGYEGRIEALGIPLFRTAGQLDASLSRLAVEADLVDIRSPWIGIYLVNFRASVNVHIKGDLSFDHFNVGASGRAEIEGEVCYFVGCSGFGGIGVNPEFNFNPFKIKMCAKIPVIGWQCLEIGGGGKPTGAAAAAQADRRTAGIPGPGGADPDVQRPAAPAHRDAGRKTRAPTAPRSTGRRAPTTRTATRGRSGSRIPGCSPERSSCGRVSSTGTSTSLTMTNASTGTPTKGLGYIGAIWPTKPNGDGLETGRSSAASTATATTSSPTPARTATAPGRTARWGGSRNRNRGSSRTSTARDSTPSPRARSGPRPGRRRARLDSCCRAPDPAARPCPRASGPNANKPRFLTTDPTCQGFAALLGIEGWDPQSPASPGQLPRDHPPVALHGARGKINYVIETGDEARATRRAAPRIHRRHPARPRRVLRRHAPLGLDPAVPAQYQFQQPLWLPVPVSRRRPHPALLVSSTATRSS